MKTICVIIKKELINPIDLELFFDRIPCFISTFEVDSEFYEFSIQCRTEDTIFVEECLADFV